MSQKRGAVRARGKKGTMGIERRLVNSRFTLRPPEETLGKFEVHSRAPRIFMKINKKMSMRKNMAMLDPVEHSPERGERRDLKICVSVW